MLCAFDEEQWHSPPSLLPIFYPHPLRAQNLTSRPYPSRERPRHDSIEVTLLWTDTSREVIICVSWRPSCFCHCVACALGRAYRLYFITTRYQIRQNQVLILCDRPKAAGCIRVRRTGLRDISNERKTRQDRTRRIMLHVQYQVYESAGCGVF